MTAPVSLVVARAGNGVIGVEGRIPWHIPDDMKRFKAITMGKPIIMGRKTWESLPRKPLPGRTNVVVTRNGAYKADGAIVATSLEKAIDRADAEHPAEIAVIGGSEIYLAALPRAAIVHLTEVHADFAGDAHLPVFEPIQWRETAREDHVTPDGLAYSFVTLERA